mgnify:CR=1 FL=1
MLFRSEAGILAEELGRALAPGPLLPTVTQYVPAVRACATAQQRADLLGPVAAGTCAGSLAALEETGFDPALTTATVRLDGDRAVLAGTKRFVMEGDAVDEIVVVAREPGGRNDQHERTDHAGDQHDLDQVEALAADRDALWMRVGAADFLSAEEKRAAVGYGPSAR